MIVSWLSRYHRRFLLSFYIPIHDYNTIIHLFISSKTSNWFPKNESQIHLKSIEGTNLPSFSSTGSGTFSICTTDGASRFDANTRQFLKQYHPWQLLSSSFFLHPHPSHHRKKKQNSFLINNINNLKAKNKTKTSIKYGRKTNLLVKREGGTKRGTSFFKVSKEE